MGDSFSGSDKAAILLLSLGEQNAAEVLRLLGPKEVQSVGMAMASMEKVNKEEATSILNGFVEEVESQTNLGVGSEEYIKTVLLDALGAGKAEGVIDRILMGHNSKGLEALKWMDSKAVAEIIRLEHPQIIAIVLSYLDSDHAADVLSQLPIRTRPDVVMRIASLDGIQPSALLELDEIMEKQFSSNTNVKSSSVGGTKVAADILNFLDTSTESEVMDSIKETDSDLGQTIEERMFVFENLSTLDDRSVQSLLREVSSDSLLLALKGSDESLKELFFKNMSKRAAEMLRDDLEAKGPVRLSEVETAQKEILVVARRLADSGDISLGGGSSDEFV
ncbi:MAG: flagellar motor switch protein FliG [Gammaproteobacteria bacterium]|nr:flagellar motor switch protein FliG [Gammaproteobacteria bacterium]